MNTRTCAPLRARNAVAVAAIRWRSLDASDSPVIPFGRLRGTLLCRQHLRDGRSVHLIRELGPTIDPRNGRCFWRAETVVCDLSRPNHDMADPLSIKPWQKSLIAAAAELEQVIDQIIDTKIGDGNPILPYTLAGVPLSAEVRPRPTKAILRMSAEAGVPWPVMWNQLAEGRRCDADDSLQWFDTRLCDRVKPGLTWPGAVALMHDLRDVPRISTWRLPLGGSVAESLFVYQPHAILDGWNGPEPLMRRLGMEYFPPPAIASLAGMWQVACGA